MKGSRLCYGDDFIAKANLSYLFKLNHMEPNAFNLTLYNDFHSYFEKMLESTFADEKYMEEHMSKLESKAEKLQFYNRKVKEMVEKSLSKLVSLNAPE